MNVMLRLILSCLLFTPTLSAEAQGMDQQGSDQQAYHAQQTSSSLKTLVKYLLNLGAYLGYNLNTDTKPQPASELINSDAMQVKQIYVFSTLLGAIPVNTLLKQFVPSTLQAYQTINQYANTTFGTEYNSSGGEQQGKISVNSMIDQKTYQSDPISQAVLNILTTPNHTYCMNNTETAWDDPSCHNLLYEDKVMDNVIGTLPNPWDFFSYDYNKQFLSQLNSDSLIAPLLYSSDAPETTGSSSTDSTTQGLTAQNQAQTAANFIRYVTGAVAPLKLPSKKEYGNVYATAITPGTSAKAVVEQKKAQAKLDKYFTSLRTYAAELSVPLSNLYYILSKRMPQNPTGESGGQTSQAMSEFEMATWRLNNPGQNMNKQWITKINTASPATVQKEIAILLAEINYQLYLNRQQEERLLLTNSISLLQGLSADKPNSNLSEIE